MDFMLDAPDNVECAECGDTVESRYAKRLSDVTYKRNADGVCVPKRTVTLLCSSCYEQSNPNL